MTRFVGRWTAANSLEVLVWAVVLIAALGMPSLWLAIDLQYQRGTLATVAAARADGVTARITDNPRLWRFEEHRLQDLVTRSMVDGDGGDRRAILDDERRIVAENLVSAKLARPLIETHTALYDAGRLAGWLSIERSVRPSVLRALSIGIASLAIGVLVLLYLKRLPLRALRRAESELEHKAYHDALTGLFNRDAFRHLLGRAVARAEHAGNSLAVLFIDLDRFKSINDTLGHDAGDEVLRSVAQRLTHSVRDNDIVARLSGDEFAIVIDGLASDSQPAQMADTLLTRFEAPFVLGGRNWHLSCSVGLSIFPQHAREPDKLLAFADTAMLHAKSSGRSSRRIYNESMQESLSQRLHIEDDLRGALGRGEFALHYQPLSDLTTGRVTGGEALLRWLHPQRGQVPPIEFIGVLEELGLIHPVGQWVLQEACRQMRAWLDQGLAVRSVSVNVSALQFGRASEFIDQVRQALQASGLPPHCLQLELTEGILMSDSERSLQVLGELAGLGVTLAIDDFGTGYSSLSYLRRFPVSTLKVDRSFVRDMCSDAKDASIVTAVVQMAHSLGLAVTAEGIETEEQLSALRALRCDIGQGYLLGRPMAPLAFAAQVRCAPAGLIGAEPALA